jgi:hypothetical protein
VIRSHISGSTGGTAAASFICTASRMKGHLSTSDLGRASGIQAVGLTSNLRLDLGRSPSLPASPVFDHVAAPRSPRPRPQRSPADLVLASSLPPSPIIRTPSYDNSLPKSPPLSLDLSVTTTTTTTLSSPSIQRAQRRHLIGSTEWSWTQSRPSPLQFSAARPREEAELADEADALRTNVDGLRASVHR